MLKWEISYLHCHHRVSFLYKFIARRATTLSTNAICSLALMWNSDFLKALLLCETYFSLGSSKFSCFFHPVRRLMFGCLREDDVSLVGLAGRGSWRCFVASRRRFFCGRGGQSAIRRGHFFPEGEEAQLGMRGFVECSAADARAILIRAPLLPRPSWSIREAANLQTEIHLAHILFRPR